MIKKIVQIRSIGKFANWSASGDVTFRKVNLIFGENGRGKSTLAAVLDSLRRGEGSLISERKTLGAAADPLVRILMEDGAVRKFGSGAWDNAVADMEVFDTSFIHSNVCAGPIVGLEHRRGLYGVIIGEKGVRLNEAVSELNAKIQAASAHVKDAILALQPLILEPIGVDEFVAISAVDDVDTKIQQKEAEIRAIRAAKEIASTPRLSKIILPPAPPLAPLLHKSLATLSTTAAHRVTKHIEEHLDEKGQPWIQTGLEYSSKGDTCPFCNQATKNNELIATYQAFFSDDYKRLKAEVATAASSLDLSFGTKAVLGQQKTVASNETAVSFWGQYTELTQLSLSQEQVSGAMHAVFSSCQAALSRKTANPLDSLELEQGEQQALAAYEQLLFDAEQYNKDVESANTVIKSVQDGAKAGSLETAVSDLARLNNSKSRHSRGGVAACDEYTAKKGAKDTLAQQKVAAKELLDKYAADIFAKYESELNRFLGLFGADFRIIGTSGKYPGGVASTTYALQIGGAKVELGDEKLARGTPAFRNTLSGGDKSALALAFFLAKLELDDRLQDKIVIIDDPVSSMDKRRMSCTSQLIDAVARRAKMTVVLSHDPHFLSVMAERFSPGDTKTLKIQRAGAESEIVEWNYAAEFQSQHVEDYRGLVSFISGGPGAGQELRDVARKIRPLVENYMRICCPAHFTTGWLGDFIELIRNSTPGDDLYHWQKRLPTLTMIKDYSKRYHHSEWQKEPIDDGELTTHADLTIKFLSGV